MFNGSEISCERVTVLCVTTLQATGVCKDCPAVWQPFLILPYEHSEKLEDQKVCSCVCVCLCVYVFACACVWWRPAANVSCTCAME